MSKKISKKTATFYSQHKKNFILVTCPIISHSGPSASNPYVSQ